MCVYVYVYRLIFLYEIIVWNVSTVEHNFRCSDVVLLNAVKL